MARKQTPVLYRHHIHTALSEAVAAMKKREEKDNGEGFCSCSRSCLEDALESLSNGGTVDIRMWE